jgi:hypothetical protein
MMIKTRTPTLAIAIAALFAASGALAGTISKADYNMEKDRASADYKADRAACEKFSGNAEDICQAQARGKEKTSLAEAEYNYTGKAGDANKVLIVKADATYAIATQMCDDKAGNAEEVCRSEAKAAHTTALADASMGQKIHAARKDDAEVTRDAEYSVAREKCNSLASDAKEA